MWYQKMCQCGELFYTKDDTDTLCEGCLLLDSDEEYAFDAKEKPQKVDVEHALECDMDEQRHGI